MSTKYLTEEQLKKLNIKAIEMTGVGTPGIQSKYVFDAVIQQPQQELFGQELYPTIWLKAAFILQKIIKTPVFVDGSKRSAVIITIEFLKQNGYKPRDENFFDQSKELTLNVVLAPNTEEEMKKIAAILERRFVSLN
ncbi:MAG: Fic family protein [Lactobacillaceae bacterium]|jgi:death-on-curing protein|nr:Fic family protein [Lactobacillaceae bacterium]